MVVSAINYFSSTEDVLKNGDGQDTGIGMYYVTLADNTLPWYVQEVSKGRYNLAGTLADFANWGENDVFGGWGFNKHYKKQEDPDDPESLERKYLPEEAFKLHIGEGVVDGVTEPGIRIRFYQQQSRTQCTISRVLTGNTQSGRWFA